MSKKEKLIDRIRNNPKNVRFEDMERLLTDAGFISRKQTSGTSHNTFYKPGCPVIVTVPYHRPVNQAYVKQALCVIDEYGSFAEEKDEE